MRIASVIWEVKPELVLTVDPFLPYEVHPDHRKIGMAAAEACILNPFMNCNAGEAKSLEQPWKLEGIVFHTTAYPNTFINVDETWDLKIKALLTHESQFDPKSFELLNMYFDYKAQQYAEGKRFQASRGLQGACTGLSSYERGYNQFVRKDDI